jgi:peroxiredoxin
MPQWIQVHVISEEEEPLPASETEIPGSDTAADAHPELEDQAPEAPQGPAVSMEEGPRDVTAEPLIVSTRHVILATMAGLLMLVLAGAIWFYGRARLQPAAAPPVARLADIVAAQGSTAATAGTSGPASLRQAQDTASGPSSQAQPLSGQVAADVARLKGSEPSSDVARRLASDKPVAIVNGEPITEGQLERDVGIGRVLYPLLRGVPVGDDPQTLERMRADLLSSLIDERLLVQAAEEAGLAIEDAALESRLEGILSRVGLAETDLAEILASVGVTMDDVRASLRSTMLAEQFVADNPAPAGVSGKSAYERWARALQQEADIQIVMEEAKGRTVKLNQPAPPFTLRTPDGDVISLSDFAGQPVLINFWATWCPPCRYEMPFLQAAYEKYKSQGFVVLAVDIQETPEVVKPFLQELGLTFPVAMDRSGAVSSAYRIQAIPTSIFVNRDGVVVDIHRGALTPDVLQGYLDRLITP